MSRVVMFGLVVVALVAATWHVASGAFTQSHKPASQANTPDARQKEILQANLNREGDAVLNQRFSEFNARHFSNSILPMPVIWEPRLSEVGELAGNKFTLLGVFGQSGDRTVILLHPSLKEDASALDRALCHEMVHAYLFTTLGDKSASHGEAFQAVLRRLSKEGAFIGVPASPQERADLRAWLDDEAKRLEADHRAISEIRDAGEFNSRSAQFRTAQDEYNRQVARYNLMVTYPDGVEGR